MSKVRGIVLWLFEYLYFEIIFTSSILFSLAIIFYVLFPDFAIISFLLLFLSLCYFIPRRKIYLFVYLVFIGIIINGFFQFKDIKDNTAALAVLCGSAKCEVSANVSSEYSCFGSYCTLDVNNIEINSKKYSGTFKIISRIENSIPLGMNQFVKFNSKFEDYINGDISANLYSLSNGEFGIFKYPTNIMIDEKSLDLDELPFILKYLQDYKIYVWKIGNEIMGRNFDVLSGILFGDKGFYNSNKSDIIDLGLAHAFVVSGFNLGIILVVLSAFNSLIGRKKVLWIGILFSVLFLFMINEINTPALRAFIMLTIFSGVRLSGYNIKMLPCIAISVFILEIINPFTFLQISFQLTFLALIGIIYFSSGFEKYISLFIPKGFSALISSTFSAILFTSPITIYYFGNLSVFGVISSLFTVVLIELITILGAIFCLLAWIPGIANVVGIVLSSWLDLFIWLLNFMREFSFSYKVDKIYTVVPIIIILVLVVIRILKEYEYKYLKKSMINSC